jgi:hypothetical protein
LTIDLKDEVHKAKNQNMHQLDQNDRCGDHGIFTRIVGLDFSYQWGEWRNVSPDFGPLNAEVFLQI